MSTHAYIGIENGDNTVSYIYSHFDGYVSYTGQRLLDYYNTREAAQELVDSGDQRVIGEPYRDRPGEIWEDIKPGLDANVDDFFNTADKCAGTYLYLFTQEGSWIVRAPGKFVKVGLRRALEKGLR